MGTFSIHLKMAKSGNEVDELSEISEEYNNLSNRQQLEKKSGNWKNEKIGKGLLSTNPVK